MSAGRRLAAFALSLAALAAAVEWLVRAHQPAFVAATNRALAKAAILDRHGAVGVLFFGTSRMQDGVAPRIFSAELERLGSQGVTAFNLAFTSSSLESLEALAARYGYRPGLRLAVIELSSPQLENGPPVWDAEAPPGSDVEGRLTAWLHAHVRALADRRALVSDNLVRLPSLLWFGEDMDGSETRVLDQLLVFLGRRERPPEGFDGAAWTPLRWTGRDAIAPTERPELADRLARLAHAFAGRVVFVVPPYTQAFETPEERGARMKSLFAAVAARSGDEVWDYSSLVLPDRWFRGKSHLNHRGRAVFSTELAREVVRAGLLRSEASAGAPSGEPRAEAR
ncbi:MAG: hypothetical protein ACYDCL_09175 [Myxococcales bacterium]